MDIENNNWYINDLSPSITNYDYSWYEGGGSDEDSNRKLNLKSKNTGKFQRKKKKNRTQDTDLKSPEESSYAMELPQFNSSNKEGIHEMDTELQGDSPMIKNPDGGKNSGRGGGKKKKKKGKKN